MVQIDDKILETRLILEDGSEFAGTPFGHSGGAAGEVVFNTGMVGYPEALTDPSYRGQILVLTYPLIGNYGVQASRNGDGVERSFESGRVQVSGLIVTENCLEHSHWSAVRSLSGWLTEHRVPALSGVDTRALTRHLRRQGTMFGRLAAGPDPAPLPPEHPVSQVSLSEPVVHRRGARKVLLVDCGCKHSIIRSLLQRDLTVIRVPWDYDFCGDDFDGIVISNGPGDPTMCSPTVDNIRRAMQRRVPILGICLGHQILALAAGASTFKLKYGHRGQNQPCVQVGTRRCLITSQNHGYAVDPSTLPGGWEEWWVNANDETNEGIRHRTLPFMSVQFHPEAAPGPLDSNFLFDNFERSLHE